MDQFLPHRNLEIRRDCIRWKRSIVELEGHLGPRYRHQNTQLLFNTYFKTGAFMHDHIAEGSISGNGNGTCRTFTDMADAVVYGASRDGVIHAWDLRGGHSSNEVPVLKSMKVSSLLHEIKALKEVPNILPREIHSMRFDPSTPYQLAFHLENGWSGVIDVNNARVTHVHSLSHWWSKNHFGFTMKRPALATYFFDIFLSCHARAPMIAQASFDHI